MVSKNLKVNERIRQVIENYAKICYRLSKETTGIAEFLLSRSVRGKCNLSLKLIDKLKDNIGLELKIRKKGR